MSPSQLIWKHYIRLHVCMQCCGCMFCCQILAICSTVVGATPSRLTEVCEDGATMLSRIPLQIQYVLDIIKMQCIIAILISAAAQAGLIPPGPFGFGGGFGGGSYGPPFMQNPFGMGLPLQGGVPFEQNGNYDASYSNGANYGKDPSQIRRDKARGRHMPY